MKKPLVCNGGFDGGGTNCGEESGLYAAELWQERILADKSIAIQENIPARAVFSRYYTWTNSFMVKAVKRLKRTLRGDFGA